jgi:hypothetical protein
MLRPSLRSSIWTGTALLALTAACDNEGRTGASTVVRDSAGVVIVENDAPIWDHATQWRVSTEPEVTIGVLDGEPEYQLFRASSASALSDGRIVVVNNGTSHLRYYSPTGRFLFATGGRGGGPGEFQSMEWGRPTSGDSMVVYERDGSLSMFDEQGRFVSTIRLEVNAKVSTTYVARLTNGNYLVLRDPEMSPEAAAKAFMEPPTGTTRKSIDAVAHDADGSTRDTLRTFPGSSFDTKNRDIPGKGVRAPIQLPVWFAPNLGAVAFADSFYVGTGDDYEILLHDAEGMVRRIVRREHQPIEVTQDAIDEAIERIRITYDETPKAGSAAPYFEAQLTWMAETPAAEHFPAYGDRFLVDAEHNLWVEHFTRERWNDDRIPEQGLRFDVFNASGHFLGSVDMPDNFQPTDIGFDYVLGLWEDEFEVQYALEFELLKPRSTD